MMYNHDMLDLYVLPLQLIHGQEETQMNNLLVLGAPRRCERSRVNDRFFVLISLLSGKAFTPDENEKLMDEAVNTYFSSRGSITSGLRAAAERLNTILLESNLHSTFEKQQRVAVVNLAALRGNDLFLAHAGTTHTFILTKSGMEEFCDIETGTRGLGVSKVTPIRYFQCSLQNADLVLFCAKPPSGWTSETLDDGAQQTLDHLRRRLMSLVGFDLQAGLVQVREGKGEIHRLKPRTRFIPAGEPPARKAPSEMNTGLSNGISTPEQPIVKEIAAEDIPVIDTPPEKLDIPQPVPNEDIKETTLPAVMEKPEQVQERQVNEPVADAESEPPIPTVSQVTTVASRHRPVRPVTSRSIGPVPEVIKEEAIPVSPAIRNAAAPVRESEEENKQTNDAWMQSLAAWWIKLRTTNRKINQTAATITSKLLPGEEPSENALSARNMLFIAIVVPLIVVAIGATVYFRLGRSERHQEFLAQAAQQVELARNTTDIQIQRETWNRAEELLEMAEKYGKSDASRQMRTEIESTLDNLDGIYRTLFQPLLVQQTIGANITRMVANQTEVYALDAAQNRVLRLELTGSTYKMDENFECSSGVRGVLVVSDLVDIVALPANSPFGATVLAVDKTGNLMYCIPEDQPVVTSLAAPDNNWGSLSDVELGGSNLFILDIPKDTILTYRGNNQSFDQNPNWFFDDQKPVLSDLIAITAYGNDVYMLHQDGSMSTCTYRLGRDDKTKCNLKAPYHDERVSAAEPEPAIMPDTHFVQMMSTDPLGPSLYILDTRSPSVYQFSLALTFIKQVRPQSNDDYPLPASEATAFVVTPGRQILMAFGNQLYSATMP
jgi:HAMP domain-containing protein